jgi:hypothetical protein
MRVLGHDETVKMEFAKTMTPRASACNPIDSVSVAGSVRVPQDLISGSKLTLIDFLLQYKLVQAAEGN